MITHARMLRLHHLSCYCCQRGLKRPAAPSSRDSSSSDSRPGWLKRGARTSDRAGRGEESIPGWMATPERTLASDPAKDDGKSGAEAETGTEGRKLRRAEGRNDGLEGMDCQPDECTD